MAKRKKVNAKRSKLSTLKSSIAQLEAIRGEYANITVNFLKGKYKCIQKICEEEHKMRPDRELFGQFCSHRFWKGKSNCPSLDKPQELLKHLFIFMIGNIPDADKHASLYKRAALNIMSSSIRRDQIAQALEDAGGIKAAAKPKKSDVNDDPELVDADYLENDNDEKADPTDEKKSKAKTAAASGTSEKKTSSPKSVSVYSEDELIVGLKNLKELCDVLEVLETEPLWLKVRFVGSDSSGFKRIVLENYDTR